jgi:hypothetical protein
MPRAVPTTHAEYFAPVLEYVCGYAERVLARDRVRRAKGSAHLT